MKKLAVSRAPRDRSYFKNDIHTVVSKLKTAGVEDIYLIGSVARNEATELSDIDFVAVCGDLTHMKRAQKNLAAHYPLAQNSVELIWFTKNEFLRKSKIGGIAFEAINEGEILLREGEEVS